MPSSGAALSRWSSRSPRAKGRTSAEPDRFSLRDVESGICRHSGARVKRASPESITTIGSMDSGPAPGGASRNDGGALACSRRANPIAVKAVGNAMAELHQRYGTGFDIGGVEHREIAAVFARAPDHRQQPAVALGGLIVAGDEHRFGNGVAGRQQIFAEALSLAIDMNDA